MIPPLQYQAFFFVVIAAAWWIAVLGAAPDLIKGLGRLRRGAPERVTRSAIIGLSMLWLVGTALRLALATWGPGDDQFRLTEAFGRRYAINLHLGSAPTVLFHLLFALLPETDTTIFAVNMFVGSLIPLAAVAVMRELGASRVAAFCAGALVAMQPLLVRASGEVNRISFVCLLALWTLWAFARYAREGRWRYFVTAIAAGWLCCRARPEAGVIVVIAGLQCVMILPRLATEHRVRRTVAALGAVGIIGASGVLALWFSTRYEPAIGRHIGELGSMSFVKPFFAAWSAPSFTSIVATVLAGLGALSLLLPGPPINRRIAAWATASLVALVALLPQDFVRAPYLAYARYHALGALVVSLLGGLGIAQVARCLAARRGAAHQWAIASVLLCAVAVSAVQPLRFVCARRVIDFEYRFLRRTLLELPDSAIIYRPYGVEMTFIGGYRDPDLLSLIIGGPEWRSWPPVEPPEEGRLEYFYVAPVCAPQDMEWVSAYPDLAEIHEACLEGVAAAAGSPVEMSEFPARTFCGEDFIDDMVSVELLPLDRE